jgi:hypothetical protein
VSEIPQAGIFALGTASHAYLELDLREGAHPRELVTGLADLREPRTTIGGVNLVAGLRPELWRDRVGAPAPAARMLDNMAGLDGPRDELTFYTTPETGAYYFVPAISALRAFATEPDED